jgi:hypothetical protein
MAFFYFGYPSLIVRWAAVVKLIRINGSAARTFYMILMFEQRFQPTVRSVDAGHIYYFTKALVDAYFSRRKIK